MLSCGWIMMRINDHSTFVHHCDQLDLQQAAEAVDGRVVSMDAPALLPNPQNTGSETNDGHCTNALFR
jgi:hypothetical protein